MSVDDFQSPSEKPLNNQINLFSLCASRRLKGHGRSPDRRQDQRQDQRQDRRSGTRRGTRRGKHRGISQGRQATIKRGSGNKYHPPHGFLVGPYDRIMRTILIQAKKRNMRTTHSMILKIMREVLLPVVRQIR